MIKKILTATFAFAMVLSATTAVAPAHKASAYTGFYGFRKLTQLNFHGYAYDWSGQLVTCNFDFDNSGINNVGSFTSYAFRGANACTSNLGSTDSAAVNSAYWLVHAVNISKTGQTEYNTFPDPQRIFGTNQLSTISGTTPPNYYNGEVATLGAWCNNVLDPAHPVCGFPSVGY